MPRPRRPRRDAAARRNKVLILLDAGLNQTEVARRLNVSRATVCRAVRRFKDLLLAQGIELAV